MKKFCIFQAYNGHVDALDAIVSFTINLDLQDARGKSTAANITLHCLVRLIQDFVEVHWGGIQKNFNFPASTSFLAISFTNFAK